MSYQCVTFSFLKVVAPIQRVKPGVQEELCPFSSPQDKTTLAQAFTVLSQDQVNFIPTQVRKCSNHAIRRHNRLISHHQRLDCLLICYFGSDIDSRIHNESMRGERQEISRMWKGSHGVTCTGNHSPRPGGARQIVVADICKEGSIS